MKNSVKQLLVSITLGALVLPAAWAQSDSDGIPDKTGLAMKPTKKITNIEDEVKIGAHYLNKDSFRYGKYSGLTDKGGYLLFDFRLEKRPDWDSGDNTRWRFEGWRMGLDSRRLEFDYLQQGKQRVNIDYRQTPNNNWQDGRTIYDGAGGGGLTLPGDWEVVPGSDNTTGFTNLLPALRPVEIKTERKSVAVDYDRDLGPGWNLAVDFKHEVKDGLRATWGVIGNSGGNPRAVGVAAPVDWNTDNLEAMVNYASGNLQLGVGVYASIFSNDEKSVSWENAYGTVNGWAPGVGYPDGVSRMALEPDNSYVQLKTYGGLNLSPTTRFTADFTFGSMKQDDKYLPYTVNPNLSAPRPLPRDDADARIDMTMLNARLTSRLASNLNLMVNYRYDDRNNKTPRAPDGYPYVGGDSQNQKSASQARLNLPYSYTEQKLAAILKWRAARATSIKGGIEWTDYKRTFSEVGDAEEITVLGGVRYSGWQTSTLSFDMSYADRDAADYVGNRPYRASKPAGTTDEDDFANHPALRKYNQFDRKRTEVRIRYDWFPNPQMNLGMTGLSQNEQFDASTFGLNEFNTRSLTIDGGWYPNPNMSLTGFITRENWQTAMSSRTFTNATPGDFDNPDKNWRHDTDEDVDTFNLHLAFKNIGSARAMNAGVSYTLSNMRNDVSTTGRSPLRHPCRTWSTKCRPCGSTADTVSMRNPPSGSPPSGASSRRTISRLMMSHRTPWQMS